MLQLVLDHKVEILSALLGLSEVLALIPQLASNSVLQLIHNGLKGLLDLFKGK